jgi:hypothetical protein
MRISILVVIIVMLVSTIKGQEVNKNLENQLFKYLDAQIDGDYDAMANHTYRPYIEIVGGDSLFLVSLSEEAEVNLNAGIIKDSSKPNFYGELVINNGETQLLINVESILRVASKQFSSEYQIIAFSSDNKNWKFVDLTNHDQESIKAFLPNLSPEIILNERKLILSLE